MKLSKEIFFEQKNENIIVAVCMLIIVVVIFAVFGWTSIKAWLSEPLIWKGQDSIECHYFGTVQQNYSDEDYDVFLGFVNNTGKEIDEYDISINVEGIEFDYLGSYKPDISAYGVTDLTLTITTDETPGLREETVSAKTLEKLLGNFGDENIDISCRIKSLKSDGETIVNNTGIYKDIIIVLISLFTGLIGFFGNIEIQWLRLIMKLLAIPAVIVLIVFLFFIYVGVYSNSPEGKAAEAESRRKAAEAQKQKATNEYKSAARTKAAAIARGDYKGAAYAQERMDKSAADMIGGNGTLRSDYKSAAHRKAAASLRGDYKTAALVQNEMDRKMADIINSRDKS